MAGNRESKVKLKLQNKEKIMVDKFWNKGHMQGTSEADEPAPAGKQKMQQWHQDLNRQIDKESEKKPRNTQELINK